MTSRTWVDADDPTVTLTEQTTILPPPPRSRLDELNAWLTADSPWHAAAGWLLMLGMLGVLVLANQVLPQFWNGAIYGALMAYLWRSHRRFVGILVGFLAGMDLAFYVAGLLW